MTAANGTAPPQVDARKLASVRKSSLTAAKKAIEALEACVTAHRGELEAGEVPAGAGLRKLADKYLQLLGTLDLADLLLTPEGLEALADDNAPEPGVITVRRDDLALMTEFLLDSPLVPEPPGKDTPLARLAAAAGPSFAKLAEMASIPAGPGVPVPAEAAAVFAEGESWYGSGGDEDGEPDPGWPSQGT